MKKNFIIFVPCIVLLLSACGHKNSVKSIKLAHGLDTSHPVHLAMQYMADDLAKRSDGKLTIKIYPNSQLGSERQRLELLQIGSLGMTKVSAYSMENFVPNAALFGLPYLFRDKEHSHQFFDSALGQELLKGSEKFLLKGLCYYDAGSRNFYTVNKNVKTPKDLKGLKIRVMESASAIKMVNTLGGAATPISWGELYTALQQGVVDGAENNLPSFHLSRHYEICKHLTLDEHVIVPDILIIGTHTWEGLNTQEQQWLKASVNASVKQQRVLWANAEQEALKVIKQEGVQIVSPNKDVFVKQTESILKELEAEKPEVFKWVQEIKKMD